MGQAFVAWCDPAPENSLKGDKDKSTTIQSREGEQIGQRQPDTYGAHQVEGYERPLSVPIDFAGPNQHVVHPFDAADAGLGRVDLTLQQPGRQVYQVVDLMEGGLGRKGGGARPSDLL